MPEPTFELYCQHTGKLRTTFTKETAPSWVMRGKFFTEQLLTMAVGAAFESKFSKIIRTE
jgi:hypothetical protein